MNLESEFVRLFGQNAAYSIIVPEIEVSLLMNYYAGAMSERITEYEKLKDDTRRKIQTKIDRCNEQKVLLESQLNGINEAINESNVSFFITDVYHESRQGKFTNHITKLIADKIQLFKDLEKTQNQIVIINNRIGIERLEFQLLNIIRKIKEKDQSITFMKDCLKKGHVEYELKKQRHIEELSPYITKQEQLATQIRETQQTSDALNKELIELEHVIKPIISDIVDNIKTVLVAHDKVAKPTKDVERFFNIKRSKKRRQRRKKMKGLRMTASETEHSVLKHI